ncbi:MAG: peptidylprolyl isomerase [Fusobacteriaceae bacterium]
MALRKFKKMIKPGIWIIVIALALSGVFYVLNQGIDSFKGNSNRVAFKLNGKNIDAIEIERTKSSIINGLAQQYKINVAPEIATTVAIDEVITKALSLKIAKELKVKVASKEVNAQYKQIEESVGGKESLKKVLSAQGFSKGTIKKEIEDQLIIQALKKKVEETQTPENIELAKIGASSFTVALNKAKKEMIIKDINENYKNFMPKIEIEKKGYSITNGEYSKRILMMMLQTGQTEEGAKKIALKQFDDQIVLMEYATKKGAKSRDDLPLDSKFRDFQNQLIDITKKNIKVSDAGVKKVFEETKKNYEKPARLNANIAYVPFKLSKEDEKANLAEAEKVLKSLTKENFADNAKKLSIDTGSGTQGGDLGWFPKGVMIPEFEEAAFKGKTSEIYPKVVKTQFGYHIIYVKEKKSAEGQEQVNASHILLPNEMTKAAKDAKIKNIEGLVAKLSSNEITFQNLKVKAPEVDFSQTFENVTANGVPGLDGTKVLAERLFKTPTKNIVAQVTDNGVYIMEKIQDFPQIKPSLENKDIKAAVTEDYITREAIKILTAELKVESSKLKL